MVQTFLPSPDFAASAAALDRRRLGKQRVEALQILRALLRPGYGWQHHPAVAMWRGHPEALAAYGLAVCARWRAGGGADTVEASIIADLAAAGLDAPRGQSELDAAGLLPEWLGDDRVHRSHRAALVAKDPEHYGPLFPDEQEAAASREYAYHWPRSGRA